MSVQIGIDVGGTFTHAVALDAATAQVLSAAQVPTTHTAQTGVASGVVEALRSVLERGKVQTSSVIFVAFSTTQATNALLEGDTSVVGILGLGGGPTSALARYQTRLGNLELAPGVVLRTVHRFVEAGGDRVGDRLRAAAGELAVAGAEVLVASAAFGPDEPELEQDAVLVAESLGLRAMAASALSGLHGLKLRTRTAVLNASILSVMMRTADMTERSVREMGIEAPVLVMRSDGGVMRLDEMRRRPILTVLSGPAAGVAAAILHARVSDGIFLEVGGTSTDISVIRDGKAQVRGARVGGHRVSVRALDITTLGVAGGSVPVLSGGRVCDVGPRSAHIAGFRYASFVRPRDVRLGKPGPDDGLMRVECAHEAGDITVTPTCAANLLGQYQENEWGRGNAESVEIAIDLMGLPGKPGLNLARRIQELVAAKIAGVVERLVEEHRLDRETIQLIGGGGGARAVVPPVARRMQLPYRLVEHAPIISAIGTAIAMLRETIEKSIVSPSEGDLLASRREAWEKLAAMGARPDTIQVELEVETGRNLLRATATGSARTDEPAARAVAADLEALATAAFPAGCGAPRRVASTGPLTV
ncbi:MAG: hydantoinase, partial [Candidatus Wallbacteria bacterium]|nr:hydantoinase [Candidatus Wallbacteria bacterium]